MTRRRIAVVTGTRAEFGLLSRLLRMLTQASDMELLLIVTGAHLSAAHGMTIHEIEREGFKVDARVDLEIGGDSPVDTAKAMGRGVIGFAGAFESLRPDVVVVLGDRYEILAAASAAAVSEVPVAHIHGGELTAGAIDDAIRHAVTKLSHVHFVAAEAYQNRVIQLGEDPARVHLVGGLGVDLARNTTLLDRTELERVTGYRFGKRNLVATFHPVTLDTNGGLADLDGLIEALEDLHDVHVAFTLPNADAGNVAVRARIESYAVRNERVWAFPSLGFQKYLSFISASDGVVGNSSSGLIEAPAMGVGTVNVGRRQEGRLRAASVIDCRGDSAEIAAAIKTLFSTSFRAGLTQIDNPYGEGGAAERIVTKLRTMPIISLLQKKFYDFPVDLAAAGAR